MISGNYNKEEGSSVVHVTSSNYIYCYEMEAREASYGSLTHCSFDPVLPSLSQPAIIVVKHTIEGFPRRSDTSPSKSHFCIVQINRLICNMLNIILS